MATTAMILGKNGELRTECRKLQIRRYLTNRHVQWIALQSQGKSKLRGMPLRTGQTQWILLPRRPRITQNQTQQTVHGGCLRHLRRHRCTRSPGCSSAKGAASSPSVSPSTTTNSSTDSLGYSQSTPGSSRTAARKAEKSESGSATKA